MSSKKVVLLAGPGESTHILYNGLRQGGIDVAQVIIEEREDKKKFIKRRIRRHGYVSTFGQLAFVSMEKALLKRNYQERIQEIKQSYSLDDHPPLELTHVTSVNSKQTRELLKEIDPAVVVINGTRIISKKTLNCVNAKFINMHAGITPRYRGVHGGYWAVANRDAGHFGVTVHLVDPGIDTGDILFQKVLTPSQKDGFSTYPYLQLAEGLPLMRRAVRDALEGTLKPGQNSLDSQVWVHPTLWKYVESSLFHPDGPRLA